MTKPRRASAKLLTTARLRRSIGTSHAALAHGARRPYLGGGGRPMTNTYAGDGFTDGFDFGRPRSRAERIARLDALATLLDTAFILPGTSVRFGFDALIGLLPGIGDAITTAISLYIVHEARHVGAPLHVIMRMLANVALDGFFGAVPVVGDAFDVMWRAHPRHARLLGGGVGGGGGKLGGLADRKGGGGGKRGESGGA